jgi:hypothetical protein
MRIKRIGMALGIATAGLAASMMAGPAAAVAAPSGGTAADTIARLQADGNRVIVNKVGTGPMENCSVASVRPVQVQQAPSANPLTGVPNFNRTSVVHVALNC